MKGFNDQWLILFSSCIEDNGSEMKELLTKVGFKPIKEKISLIYFPAISQFLVPEGLRSFLTIRSISNSHSILISEGLSLFCPGSLKF